MALVSQPRDAANWSAISRACSSDVGAGTGFRDGVAEPGDPGSFGMDADGDLFLVEGFEVARHPDLYGAVALEEGGGSCEGKALEEVFAGQGIGTAPMGGGIGDVLEDGGFEAL
jgi:hypothetical protein